MDNMKGWLKERITSDHLNGLSTTGSAKISTMTEDDVKNIGITEKQDVEPIMEKIRCIRAREEESHSSRKKSNPNIPKEMQPYPNVFPDFTISHRHHAGCEFTHSQIKFEHSGFGC